MDQYETAVSQWEKSPWCNIFKNEHLNLIAKKFSQLFALFFIKFGPVITKILYFEVKKKIFFEKISKT